MKVMHALRTVVLLIALASLGGASALAQGMSILGVQGDTQTRGVPGAPVDTLPPTPDRGTGNVIPSGVPVAPLSTPASLQSDLPLVYYILVPTGDDESYFEALARGTPANVMNMARQDAQSAKAASGARGDVHFIRVKLASLEDYARVLHEGLLPAHSRAGTPVYRVSELIRRPNRVLGFAILSHAGCDGPFIPLENGKGAQAPFPIFSWDRASNDPNSFYNRLVYGARIRFAGCNTGNDYMWYEVDVPGYSANPSVAHATAAILADKRVTVYGHYNSGDVKNADYVHFACPQGQAYPVRYVKPKDGYSFGTTQGASQYEPAVIHYRSAEERDAYIRYYDQRGYPLKAKNERRTAAGVEGDLVLRAPKPIWFSRGSAKPAVLKNLLSILADNPGVGTAAITYAFSGGGADSGNYRGLIPRLAALIQYGKLQQAIRDTRTARGGRLDLDDFRLWVMMFGPDHNYTAYRADLCDDANLARVQFKR